MYVTILVYGFIGSWKVLVMCDKVKKVMYV